MQLRDLSPALVCLFSLLATACGDSADSGSEQSCGGLGTFELSAGPYHGVSSVRKFLGTATSESFTMFADECTGDATGSLYDIPTAVGSYDFRQSTNVYGSVVIGPNVTLGLPGADYTVGFDLILDCAPCGSGTITITASDAYHVAGTIDATAWMITGSFGSLGADPNSTLPVSGTFEARWE